MRLPWRIKTDRRDAINLAKLHRAGELTPVWVPDQAHEAIRDLVRARQAAVRTLRQAPQQLSGFLLRHGRHYHRPAWTQLHRRWLASLKFDQAVHHVVLEDCIAAVEAAMARRDRLEAHIEAVLPEWSLGPVVVALQALRSVRLVAAATLVAELGDITRFTNPRQLMAYLGLVPSEHSSGRTRRQGGITKAGNGAARRMLIEAAWSYRFPARIAREQLLRQEMSRISQIDGVAVMLLDGLPTSASRRAVGIVGSPSRSMTATPSICEILLTQQHRHWP